ncbi:GNAT family N-acetyltransferase [Streptomyces sp. CB03238]|uniref:GNAT family N-acetyltransferase n=1 Tax=Streptomyces sp. CB03238 TaxID=1907777 RepID=UPI000A10ED23|nr:GNAT family N-acetyltransferase [Streptomyces sp. CB03238]ORT57361.1 hypothetical protein BKD26_24170 [Streptomyces sp. CB03238]
MTSVTSARLHDDGLARIPPADWRIVAGDDRLDLAHPYLAFREHVEPGRPVALTLADQHGPAVAVHGALTTPSTALFSHPWKMLTSPQFLRADERPAEAAALRAEHTALIEAVAGPATAPGSGETPAPHLALSRALGEALVIRGFDSSEVIRRPDLPPAARLRASTDLIAAAQDAIRDGLAGAVVLPFVDPGDQELRQVLGARGFQQAELTAISLFDLSRHPSYDAFLASMPRDRRYRFRSEPRALETAGLRLETVRLDDTVERVTELEVATARKYGGTPRPDALLATRRAMAGLLGHAIRVPAVRRPDGTIIACGLHLADGQAYYALVYGCDYGDPERSTSYQCVNFYDPLRYALDNGIRRVRMGFEAFAPKLLRGARLVPRETWLWVPDRRRLEALGRLLRFLGERCGPYLAALASHHRPPA